MPDLLVGSLIQAADFPPTVSSTTGTDVNNISNTTFAYGSPVISVTFTAPTSGRVLVVNTSGLRDNSGVSAGYIDIEIRQTNSSGTVVKSASKSGPGTLSVSLEASSGTYKSRVFLQTGLTPGATYWAAVMHACDSGSSVDILARGVIVQPVP